jgi:hypothetical protein
MNPSIFTFDVAAFRVQFPAFANDDTFPDAVLTQYWNQAITCISPVNYGFLNGDSRLLALNLLTAHFTQSSVIIANGQVPGITQSATVDKVTVTLDPAPKPNQWQWSLNQTAYGQQLLFVLQSNAAGGFIFGGWPERAAIRISYGVFF